MPEAVNSDSINAPQGQPTPVVFSTDIDAFRDTVYQIKVLSDMLASYLEDAGMFEESTAIGALFNMLVDTYSDRVEMAARDLAKAREFIERRARQADLEREKQADQLQSDRSKVWLELMMHLTSIVTGIWREAGREPDENNEDHRKSIAEMAQDYGRRIMEQLENKGDRIEAGSYLPWAEMKIRQELTGEPSASTATSLRDTLIAEHSEKGITVQELSQAFNLRRAAVERIIGRLSPSYEMQDRAS